MLQQTSCFLLLPLLLGIPFAARAGGIALTGVVLDAQGRPFRGAAIQLRRPSRAPASTAISDVQGRFRAEVPEAGVWRVAVEAPGFIPQQVRSLVVPASVELEEVRLTAETPLRVAVFDALGEPVAGARVRISFPWGDDSRFDRSWQPMPRYARTGEDGAATLPIGVGESVHLTVIARGFLEAEFKNLYESSATVHLERGCQRALEIVDSQDQPAAGVLLQGRHWRLGKTDRTGRVKITAPCNRELDIRLLAPDGSRASRVLKPRFLGQPAEARLVLPVAEKLSGVVLERGSHRPLPGILVWPEDDPAAFTVSDRQGRYTVRGPGRKDAGLAATANGFETARSLADPVAAQGERRADGSRKGPTLYLSPTIAIGGLLTDQAGQPLAGAEIELSADRLWSKLRTRSDAKGAFRLRLPAGLLYSLVIHHAGFVPREISFPGESRDGLRIVLGRGKTAGAEVQDEAGRPMAGVEGILVPADRDSRRYYVDEWKKSRSLSDGSGRLRLTGLSAGRFDLVLRAEKRMPMTVSGLEVQDAERVTELGVFRFPPEVRIEGFVIDDRGHPVPGALVTRDSDPTFEGVRTGANGSFVMTGPRGSEVDLTAGKAGYNSGFLKKVVVPTREPVTIRLRPAPRASHVSGSVRDEKGEPIAGAHLVFLAPSVKEMMRQMPSVGFMPTSAYASEDGSFSIELSEPGTVTLTVSANCCLPKTMDLEVPEGRDLENLGIVLSSGTAALAGRVTEPDGEPIAGLYLSLWKKKSSGEESSRTSNPVPSTDSDGFYRIGGLTEGLWNVYFSAFPFLASPRELELHAGENRLDVQLQRGSKIEGQVVDESGRPVQGATLRLSSPEAPAESGGLQLGGATDDHGHFAIDGIEPGHYRLQTERAGYARSEPLPLDLTRSPVRSLKLVLHRGGTIRGKVLGLNARQLGDLTVTAYQPPGWSKEAPIDAGGEYRIQGLEPGEWVVSAWISGRKAEAQVLVAAGADEKAPDLNFEPGVSLTGAVLRQGKPVPNLLVQAYGTSFATAQDNSLGEFRLEDLSPGTYTVRIFSYPLRMPPEAPLLEQKIELPADRYVVLELPSTQETD